MEGEGGVPLVLQRFPSLEGTKDDQRRRRRRWRKNSFMRGGFGALPFLLDV